MNKPQRNVIIFGATSTIAQGVAQKLINDGHHLFLVARDEKKLRIVAADLSARSQKVVQTRVADLNTFEQHESILQEAINALGSIEVVLIAHGTLSEQKQCEQCFQSTQREYETNFLSVASILLHTANYLEQRQQGTIAVISSVAGDRGRQSNYVYGSAKAALSALLQGLRNRLSKANVHVLTIKPGFVDTQMTQHVEKNFLFASPDKVSSDIVNAIYKNKVIIYTPGFWRYIMIVIKLIPEKVFLRLSL